jgi:hypothetical protein
MKPFNQDIIHSLKNYEDEPDQEVWEGLEKDLNKGKKRKRLAVFFAVLCLFILFGSVTMLIMQPKMVATGSNLNSRSVEITGPIAIERSFEKSKPEQGMPPNTQARTFTQRLSRPNLANIYALPGGSQIPSTLNSDPLISVDEEQVLGRPKLKKLNPLSMKLPELQQVNMQPKINMPNRSYFAGFMIMPAISHRILVGDKSLITLRNQRETSQSGFALGISAGKRFNPSLDISLGIHFVTYTQKIWHDWNEVLIGNDSVLVKKRSTNETFYHHFIDTTKMDQAQSYINRFSVIQIPLSLNFHKPISARMSMYTSVGLQLNYILQSRVNVNYQTNQGLLIEKTPHQSSYSRFGGGLQAGIGLSRKLADHYELSGGLHANISSNYFTKGRIREYPYMIGLQLGIRKYF